MPNDASISKKAKDIMKKFLSPNSKPTVDTFPELVDCIVWLRFVLAIVFGIWVAKQSQSKGGANIVFGLNFIAFPPIFWCQTFLGADQESYGGKLYFSGIVQGLALAMLIVVYSYTQSHTHDESSFASAFSSLLVGGDADSGISGENGKDTGIPEESEF